jgi:rhodanese-related sulfurtransferase|tara:strand:- start:4071 stop:4487 length:417 start_codon:yes stop_codon:yes gene_type:complete
MNIYEFINNNLIISAGLILSFLLLIFNELRIKKQQIANIDAYKAVQLINSGANIFDVRSAELFKKGHIVNSKNFNSEQIISKKKSLINKTTVVICETGQSSSKIVNEMRALGVENIFGISGGIAGWSEANMPLVSKKK